MVLWCPVLVMWVAAGLGAGPAIEVGDRRELFVDGYLIEELSGVRLMLHEPRDEGVALRFDRPWEGPFCGYCTVLQDGERRLLYYRGKAKAVADGQGEVTCVAQSADGVRWTRPRVGAIAFEGSFDNNIILNVDGPTHNFSPLLDRNPAAPPDRRFKAFGGTQRGGIFAFASPDGLAWKPLQDEPVLTFAMVKAALPAVTSMFDSQNLAFWSPAEGKYLAYFRVVKDKIRRIARAESDDLLHWTNIQLMEYRTLAGTPAPIEHLYTSQTHPYFRAPHLLIALAARFMPGRQVLSAEEAAAIGVNPGYFKDTSDAIFMTTRGGPAYDRTFLSSFIRPGIGANNWVSRTNYPALGVIPTGETEMSCYTNQDYAQPTSHLRRYSLRLDGFGSAHADYGGGELVTRPLVFSGNRLTLNFATSAAGGIRVEIQDADGRPIPGFALADARRGDRQRARTRGAMEGRARRLVARRPAGPAPPGDEGRRPLCVPVRPAVSILVIIITRQLARIPRLPRVRSPSTACARTVRGSSREDRATEELTVPARTAAIDTSRLPRCRSRRSEPESE